MMGERKLEIVNGSGKAQTVVRATPLGVVTVESRLTVIHPQRTASCSLAFTATYHHAAM